MPLTLLLTPSVLPSASGRVLLAFGCPTVSVLPSTQLLDRSALRPVDGFHHPPWMVVTPSTTMASADFCPSNGQTSQDKVRSLSPEPCRVYVEPLWSFSGLTVSCQLTPRSPPPYAVFVHQVRVLPSGFLSTYPREYAVALG